HSAKKIGGVRSYELARDPGSAAEATAPDPVPVQVRRLELMDVDADLVRLRLECSAGFYVRSLAHDLGDRLGGGGPLAALPPTRGAGYGWDAPLPWSEAEQPPARARAAVIPMRQMLPDFPAVTLPPDDVRKAINGRDIAAAVGPAPVVRLL